jgi:hypothetical protein
MQNTRFRATRQAVAAGTLEAGRVITIYRARARARAAAFIYSRT